MSTYGSHSYPPLIREKQSFQLFQLVSIVLSALCSRAAELTTAELCSVESSKHSLGQYYPTGICAKEVTNNGTGSWRSWGAAWVDHRHPCLSMHQCRLGCDRSSMDESSLA